MTMSITKSIRLSPAESEELAQLSERTALSEAALMKRWIQEGLRAQKLELAIQAYMKRQVSLSSGAAMAGVSYNRFMREVQERNIVILDDEEGFLEGLAFLAEAFDDEVLKRAVAAVARSAEE